jgi:hypothetical protein
MADRAKKISELAVLTSPSNDDLLVIVDSPANNAITKQITVSNFFNNAAANVTVGNTFYLSANNFVIRRRQTPAVSSGTADVQGSIWFDLNYIYVATANGTIKRAALSSF